MSCFENTGHLKYQNKTLTKSIRSEIVKKRLVKHKWLNCRGLKMEESTIKYAEPQSISQEESEMGNIPKQYWF